MQNRILVASFSAVFFSSGRTNAPIDCQNHPGAVFVFMRIADLQRDRRPKERRILVRAHYAGTDHGLYFSYDRTRSWILMNNLPVTEFYAVAVDMEKPYNI